MTEPKQPEANNLAIASLILGILSITLMGPLTGIPAIITGAIGLKNPVNKGMNVAGIVMGSISLLFAVLAVLFFAALLLFGVFAASSYEDKTIRQDSRESLESSIYRQRA